MAGFLLCAAIVSAKEPRESSCNGEFQYRAHFNNGGVDGGAPRDFTAYLWIPPHSQRVRAVLVTHQNVGEQVFTEHPVIREACADHDVAIVWCYPAADLRFQHDRERAVRLQENVLRTLGEVSGYGELAEVPWITFGHSSTITYARNAAEARPNRVLAVMSAKGGVSFPPAGTYDGPILYSAGQFPEWRQPTHDWTQHGASLAGLARLRDAQAQLSRPYSFLEEYGGGHFDYSEAYLGFLALYLRKTLQHRLSPSGQIRPVEFEQGYYLELLTPLPNPPYKIVSAKTAVGATRSSPWYYDEETARAASALMGSETWDRKNQIVAFANLDGQPAPFSKSGIVDPVPMEFAEDGVTIRRIETTFLDRLPANFTQAGMAFSHAGTGAPTIERVSGIFAVHDGRYSIQLNRGYPETPNFIVVRHRGDATHRPSVQPGRVAVPTYSGRSQTIEFPPLPNQSVHTKEVALRATSSADLPVHYFVRSGPAKIEEGRLILLPLPPRTRLPVEVSVVAWQLGRGGNDPVSAAPLTERTFQIVAEDNQ